VVLMEPSTRAHVVLMEDARRRGGASSEHHVNGAPMSACSTARPHVQQSQQAFRQSQQLFGCVILQCLAGEMVGTNAIPRVVQRGVGKRQERRRPHRSDLSSQDPQGVIVPASDHRFRRRQPARKGQCHPPRGRVERVVFGPEQHVYLSDQRPQDPCGLVNLESGNDWISADADGEELAADRDQLQGAGAGAEDGVDFGKGQHGGIAVVVFVGHMPTVSTATDATPGLRNVKHRNGIRPVRLIHSSVARPPVCHGYWQTAPTCTFTRTAPPHLPAFPADVGRHNGDGAVVPACRDVRRTKGL